MAFSQIMENTRRLPGEVTMPPRRGGDPLEIDTGKAPPSQLRAGEHSRGECQPDQMGT